MKEHFAANAQLIRSIWNMRGCHRIAKKVEAPFQLEVRLNFQTHFLNAQVMAFSGSKD